MTDLRKAAEAALQALQLIQHATAPEPDDGGHHEAAHDLSTAAIADLRAALAEPPAADYVSAPPRVTLPPPLCPHLTLRQAS